MARSKRNRQAHVRRDILGTAVSLIGFGGTMFIVSLFLRGQPALVAVGKGLRSVAPWPIFIGGLVLLLYYALNRAAALPKIDPRDEPPFIEKPTTTFDDMVKRAGTLDEPTRRAPAPRPAPAASRERSAERAMPAKYWSPAVFDAIEWRRFEALCEALFAQAGFQAKSQSHGADGGVDIWLYSKNATGPAAVVQCKHWTSKPVGVKEIREFFGVMASHGLKRGTYATSSTYTADALKFAKDNGISALDRDGLLSLIAKRDPQQQADLLRVAYEGEYWRPTCASCGIKMVEREPKKGGAKFWGCARYPKCQSKLQMRTV